ncbi:hypothetical protein [Maritimibacter dapengensis]|uniref:Uncharacterized protein n=1 Tax=Maritimibacter dapengensis TaxID=2836868 RepID=A0ABS6SWX4_9RHOB|nr:hypothetical protein [Maritimibacter dapengensis]MBV7377454.1 hypothetical protein [Maritimibacter dapengensis]
MADLVLTKTRIQAGVWEGVLTGADTPPDITVTHNGQEIAGASLRDDPDIEGQFRVFVPIPQDLLSEGVQTFLISEKASGDRLASFTVVTGQPLDEDFRAEMELLRAELDMLKRAFRRHCVETM